MKNMTDNIKKNIENEELDLEQLENVSGGLNYDKLALADSKLMMGDKMMMGDMKLGMASGLASGLASRLAFALTLTTCGSSCISFASPI